MNQNKDILQSKCKELWYKTEKGTLALATGTGKSKIAVDIIHENPSYGTIVLVVPTEKLRDENWHEEFKKWKCDKDYYRIERICYASMAKTIIEEDVDLLILDECHNITENNSVFFNNNKVKRILGLTATPPEDEVKKELFLKFFPVIYTYTLDEGVKDSIVAPYEIIVVETRLDDSEKYVKAGTKEKPFLTTEYKHYNFLSQQILKLQYAHKAEIVKWKILERMRFIYNLKSKTDIARKIINEIIKDDRALIFCGSIAQAEELCKHTFHSKTSDKDLKKFINGKINHLSSIKCLNEGINMPNLNSCLIVQLNSKEKDAIQRIGRLLRLRDGHLAKIYILSVINTVDENWTKKALKQFDSANITYVNYKNLFK